MWLGGTLKKSSNIEENTLKRFSSLLNVSLLFVCAKLA